MMLQQQHNASSIWYIVKQWLERVFQSNQKYLKVFQILRIVKDIRNSVKM